MSFARCFSRHRAALGVDRHLSESLRGLAGVDSLPDAQAAGLLAAAVDAVNVSAVRDLLAERLDVIAGTGVLSELEPERVTSKVE